MTLNREKAFSKSPIPAGKIQIEVKTQYDTKERLAPATVTVAVNGKEVAKCHGTIGSGSAHRI